MKRCPTVLCMLLVLALTSQSRSLELGGERNPNDPLDQGGETCALATVIPSLPYCDSGTTSGHLHDYSANCYAGFAPDVVYSYTPTANGVFSFSLCGSSYNTAMAIWNGCPGQGGVLVRCSDNTCDNDACCSGVTLQGGVQYFIIVDGGVIAPNSGAYVLHATTDQQCPQSTCEELCPYPSRDVEPNQTCSTPQTTVTCGDTICGFMEQSSNDYFVFVVPGPGPQMLTIDVFGNDTPGLYPFGGGLNPSVEVQTCVATFANDDNSGVGNDARLDSLCMDPGTYLIRIAAGQPQVTFGPYILAIACTPCGCPYSSRDFEAVNNECATFNPPVTCGDTLCGQLSLADGVDWYLLTVPGPDTVRCRVDILADDTPGYFPFGQGLNPFFRIYGNDCQDFLIGDSDSGVGDDAMAEICLAPGTHNIGIASDDGSEGSYLLIVSCGSCNVCPYPSRDVEALNNGCSTVNPPVACGDTLCGELSQGDFEDWYLLTVPGPDSALVRFDVFANSTPGFFPYGQGLDPNINVFLNTCDLGYGGGDNAGVGNDSYFAICLAPGTYNIQIASNDFTEGPYVLAVTCDSCSACPYPNFDAEPQNNFCGTFNRFLECRDLYCGSIGYPTDQDWYVLQIDTCLALQIIAYGNGTPNQHPFGQGLNPAVEIWSQDCETLIARDLNSGIDDDAQLKTICLDPGVYNLVVYGETRAPGPYVIDVFCFACECTPACDVVCPPSARLEGEPCPVFLDTTNGGCDTQSNIQLLSCNDEVCGTSSSILPYSDSDWYRLTVEDPTGVRICLDAEFNATIRVFASDSAHSPCVHLELIQCEYVAKCAGPTCPIVCLPPGQFYVVVHAEGPELFNCQDYYLSTACTDCIPLECPAPDSVVIHYPDTLGIGNDLEDIALYWTPVPGAYEYRIFRTSNPNGTFFPTPTTYVATTTDTFFVHEDVVFFNVNEEYIYYIVARCSYNPDPCLPNPPDLRDPRRQMTE